MPGREFLALIVLFSLLASAGHADILIAAGNLRAQSVISPSDIAVVDGDMPGALTRPEDAIGLETRVTIYAGRPIRTADVGPAAIIARNQIVSLSYRRGPLSITAEGRALDRAAPGDYVRVMNLASRTTITARVEPDGTLIVNPGP